MKIENIKSKHRYRISVVLPEHVYCWQMPLHEHTSQAGCKKTSEVIATVFCYLKLTNNNTNKLMKKKHVQLNRSMKYIVLIVMLSGSVYSDGTRRLKKRVYDLFSINIGNNY